MLKAQVAYFPTYFGHIGVKVYNPANPFEQGFFDFGALYDINHDTKLYGVKPIYIDLPEIDISWQEFLARTDKTPYTGIYDKEKSKQYNLLTNNCAHATQQVLHMVGYITDKPSPEFALTPNKVAEQAYALGKVNFGKQRLQKIEKLATGDSQEYIANVANIIDSCIAELDLHAKVKRNAAHRKSDRDILSKIKFDGSEDSIARLLKACETTSEPVGSQLQTCVTLLPPFSYLKISINRLEEKAQASQNDNQPGVAKAAFTLVKTLRQNIAKLTKKTITPDNFEKENLLAISKAAPELAKHRDYRMVLGNIALAIVGAGILYLVAATIKKSITGSFLFFNNKPSHEPLPENSENVRLLGKNKKS